MFDSLYSSFGLQSLINGTALALALGVSGCGSDGSRVNPVGSQEPSGPAALSTVVSTDLAPQSNGCQYGTATYTLNRSNTSNGVIVAAQTSCPAGYEISGICHPFFRFGNGSAILQSTPLVNSVCYDPSVTTDEGIDACQVGALVCAIAAPGDVSTESTSQGSDGQQVTSYDTTP